jgi:spore photoproduct lyase
MHMAINKLYRSYFQAKRFKGISLSLKKNIRPKVNGRSADFVMSAPIVGCQLVCQYCNISRHREFGNPIEQYTNIEQILLSTRDHLEGLPQPKVLNQTGPLYTYDICEASDALSGANIDITNKIVNYFMTDPVMKERAQCTFATKLTNYKGLVEGNRKNTRLRLSLMPETIRSKVEFGTATISQRLKSINHFYDKGWEVHINFSPIILTDNWLLEYKELVTYSLR